MDLRDVAQWYAERRLGRALSSRDAADAVRLTPWQTLEALWVFHPLFTPRWDAIEATPYSETFDAEADEALVLLAKVDSFDHWDGLSAGAWRVLFERLAFLEVVILANEAEGAKVFTGVPRALDQRSRSRMLLLTFLLGPARTIDRGVLPKSDPGKAPKFPSSMPLRRQ